MVKYERLLYKWVPKQNKKMMIDMAAEELKGQK